MTCDHVYRPGEDAYMLCGEEAVDDLQSRFLEFHEANPHIYDEFVSRARRLKAVGFTQAGARMIVESIRFDFSVDTTRTDDFKINNDWSPRYARMAMERESDLAEFFETRVLTR